MDAYGNIMGLAEFSDSLNDLNPFLQEDSWLMDPIGKDFDQSFYSFGNDLTSTLDTNNNTKPKSRTDDPITPFLVDPMNNSSVTNNNSSVTNSTSTFPDEDIQPPQPQRPPTPTQPPSLQARQPTPPPDKAKQLQSLQQQRKKLEEVSNDSSDNEMSLKSKSRLSSSSSISTRGGNTAKIQTSSSAGVSAAIGGIRKGGATIRKTTTGLTIPFSATIPNTRSKRKKKSVLASPEDDLYVPPEKEPSADEEEDEDEDWSDIEYENSSKKFPEERADSLSMNSNKSGQGKKDMQTGKRLRSETDRNKSSSLQGQNIKKKKKVLQKGNSDITGRKKSISDGPNSIVVDENINTSNPRSTPPPNAINGDNTKELSAPVNYPPFPMTGLLDKNSLASHSVDYTHVNGNTLSSDMGSVNPSVIMGPTSPAAAAATAANGNNPPFYNNSVNAPNNSNGSTTWQTPSSTYYNNNGPNPPSMGQYRQISNTSTMSNLSRRPRVFQTEASIPSFMPNDLPKSGPSSIPQIMRRVDAAGQLPPQAIDMTGLPNRGPDIKNSQYRTMGNQSAHVVVQRGNDMSGYLVNTSTRHLPGQSTLPMRAPPPGSRTPIPNGYYPSHSNRSRLYSHSINHEQIITNVNHNLNINDQLLGSLKNSNDTVETLDLILAFRANIKRSLKELDQLPLRSGGRGVMPSMIENKESDRESNHHQRLIPKNIRKFTGGAVQPPSQQQQPQLPQQPLHPAQQPPPTLHQQPPPIPVNPQNLHRGMIVQRGNTSPTLTPPLNAQLQNNNGQVLH